MADPISLLLQLCYSEPADSKNRTDSGYLRLETYLESRSGHPLHRERIAIPSRQMQI